MSEKETEILRRQARTRADELARRRQERERGRRFFFVHPEEEARIIGHPEAEGEAPIETPPLRKPSARENIGSLQQRRFERQEPPPTERRPGFWERVIADGREITTGSIQTDKPIRTMAFRGGMSFGYNVAQSVVDKVRGDPGAIEHQEYKAATQREQEDTKKAEKEDEALIKYTEELLNNEKGQAEEYLDQVTPTFRLTAWMGKPKNKWEGVVGALSKRRNLKKETKKVAQEHAIPGERAAGFGAILAAARKRAENQLGKDFEKYQREEYLKTHPLEGYSAKDLLKLASQGQKETAEENWQNWLEHGYEEPEYEEAKRILQRRAEGIWRVEEAKRILQRRAEGRKLTIEPSSEDLLKQATEDSDRGSLARSVLRNFVNIWNPREIPQDFLDVLKEAAGEQPRRRALKKLEKKNEPLAKILKRLKSDGVPGWLLASAVGLGEGLKGLAMMGENSQNISGLPDLIKSLRDDPAYEQILQRAYGDEFRPLEESLKDKEEGFNAKHSLLPESLVGYLADNTSLTPEDRVLLSLLFASPDARQGLEDFYDTCLTKLKGRILKDTDEGIIGGLVAGLQATGFVPPGKPGELPSDLAEAAAKYAGKTFAMAIPYSVAPDFTGLGGEISTQDMARGMRVTGKKTMENLPAPLAKKVFDEVIEPIGDLETPERLYSEDVSTYLRAMSEHSGLEKHPEIRSETSWQMGKLIEKTLRTLKPAIGSLAQERKRDLDSSPLTRVNEFYGLLPDGPYRKEPEDEIVLQATDFRRIGLRSLSKPSLQPTIDRLGIPGLTSSLTRQEAAFTTLSLFSNELERVERAEKRERELQREQDALWQRLAAAQREEALEEERVSIPDLTTALEKNIIALDDQITQTEVARAETGPLLEWFQALFDEVDLGLETPESESLGRVDVGKTSYRIIDKRPVSPLYQRAEENDQIKKERLEEEQNNLKQKLAASQREDASEEEKAKVPSLEADLEKIAEGLEAPTAQEVYQNIIERAKSRHRVGEKAVTEEELEKQIKVVKEFKKELGLIE